MAAFKNGWKNIISPFNVTESRIKVKLKSVVIRSNNNNATTNEQNNQLHWFNSNQKIFLHDAGFQ